MRHLIILLSLFLLSSCAGVDSEKGALVLKPAQFSDLPGWAQDDQAGALSAFARSCERILKNPPDRAFGPDGVGGTFGDWQPACRALPESDPALARAYFERWFSPWKATMDGRDDEGLFTGYYEPALNGSRVKGGAYTHPLYKKPDDLVMVDLGTFRDELKGQRIAGRVVGGHLKPYEDRAAIEAGRWPHNDSVLIWVDDPVDSFFLHIQGSGRVNLADGSVMRVGYDGQNGHIYYAIGRELIKRGLMDKDDVSLQSIRDWLEANPGEAADLMNMNRSYVFFRELDEDGPLGGEGVALTPERSLAVDRSLIPYGVPTWAAIDPPTSGEDPLRRLMVAQDTGGAIQGAVRGDVFWGSGERAAWLAGQMKSKGRYWLLLPRTEN